MKLYLIPLITSLLLTFLLGKAHGAADLVVTEIRVVQPVVNVNDMIQFKVTVKNQGKSATSSNWLGVTVDIDGAYATWGGYNATIAAGDSREITTDYWKATKTTFKIRGYADFPNFYPEDSELNNKLEVVYPFVSGIDLIVVATKVVQSAVIVNDKINFDVILRNQGDTSTGYIWVGVNVFCNGVWATWGGQNISLAPGASVKIRTKAWVATTSSFSMLTNGDFSNNLAEANETNNSFTTSYTSPPAIYQTLPTTNPWVLKWSDEFNIDGVPDSTKWGNEIGFLRNAELQYFTARPENVRVAGGNLIIEARKEVMDITGAQNAWGATTTKYTSASLTTQGKAAWTYGRIDIRAKIPTGRGMWPALWTLGTNLNTTPWPKCGEIDILESVGWDVDAAHASIHTNDQNHMINTEFSTPTWINNIGATYHIYGIEWDSAKIAFFVNGRQVSVFNNNGNGEDAWPFFRDQYLIINAAVGGSWGGVEGVDDSLFPQQMLVDYVRIYQKDN